MATPPQRATEGRRDLFLSHASEDKDWVGPLAVALGAEGLDIWYDEYEFQIGDNVRAKMDQGLRHSRYGLVVFSSTFFEKFWTQYELDGLFARQSAGEQVILPIWHRLTMDEIARHSPSLTSIYALNSSIDSVEVIAHKVAVKVKGTAGTDAAPQPQTPPDSAVPQSHTFGVFYIAPARHPGIAAGPDSREEQLPSDPDRLVVRYRARRGAGIHTRWQHTESAPRLGQQLVRRRDPCHATGDGWATVLPHDSPPERSTGVPAFSHLRVASRVVARPRQQVWMDVVQHTTNMRNENGNLPTLTNPLTSPTNSGTTLNKQFCFTKTEANHSSIVWKPTIVGRASKPITAKAQTHIHTTCHTDSHSQTIS